MLDASVIIPTYNRFESLQQTLAALCHQSWPMDRFEVIIVDDGSVDNTCDIQKDVFPFSVKYIRQANQGSAVARNTGARAAQGKLLIFLDDDMWVEPDYIGGLIKEHHRYPRIIGMGTLHAFETDNPSPFAAMAGRPRKTEDLGPSGGPVDFRDCVTNNLSVNYEDFFDIGMMQDVAGDGPTWWGDIDFGFRAKKLGFGFRRSGEAVCIHRDYSIRNFSLSSQRYYKAAMMAVPLFQKHPDLFPYISMLHDKVPISWSDDPFALKIRKLSRRMASFRPIIWGLEKVAMFLEKYYPKPALLSPLYIWIHGGYMYRGYQEGLHKAKGQVHGIRKQEL